MPICESWCRGYLHQLWQDSPASEEVQSWDCEGLVSCFMASLWLRMAYSSSIFVWLSELPVSEFPMFAASPRNSMTSISQSFMILLQDLPELPTSVSFMFHEINLWLSFQDKRSKIWRATLQLKSLSLGSRRHFCGVVQSGGGSFVHRLPRGRLYTSTFFHPSDGIDQMLSKEAKLQMSLFCGKVQYLVTLEWFWVVFSWQRTLWDGGGGNCYFS